MKLCIEAGEEAGETVILLLLVHLKSNYEMEKYWVLKKLAKLGLKIPLKNKVKQKQSKAKLSQAAPS